MEDVVRSQDKMRERLTGTRPEDFRSTVGSLQAHLDSTRRLLARLANVEWLEIEFEELVRRSPAEVERLREFCGLAPEFACHMAAVVKSRPDESIK
jgi:hypothetical protein